MRKRVVIIADSDETMGKIVAVAMAVHAEVHVINERPDEDADGVILGPAPKAMTRLPAPKKEPKKRERAAPGQGERVINFVTKEIVHGTNTSRELREKGKEKGYKENAIYKALHEMLRAGIVERVWIEEESRNIFKFKHKEEEKAHG